MFTKFVLADSLPLCFFMELSVNFIRELKHYGAQIKYTQLRIVLFSNENSFATNQNKTV